MVWYEANFGYIRGYVTKELERRFRPFLSDNLTRLSPHTFTALNFLFALLASVSILLGLHLFVVIFGIGCAALFDLLDGITARSRHVTSRLGTFLDGMVDRFNEIMILSAIGIQGVFPVWFAATLLLSGLMINYLHLHLAQLGKLYQPALIEKPERVVIITGMLVMISINTVTIIIITIMVVISVLQILSVLQIIIRGTRHFASKPTDPTDETFEDDFIYDQGGVIVS